MKKNLLLLTFAGLMAAGCQVYAMEENQERQTIAALKEELVTHRENGAVPLMFTLRCEQLQQQLTNSNQLQLARKVGSLLNDVRRINRGRYQAADVQAKRTLFGNDDNE